ncbi:MAG: CPBP family intramembrane glutamic endopeptidase [Leptolyngbya sp. IPPAS B-1204]|nr:CPBP family intramembrane metalloprotease [Elainella sp. C42_A2020_010]RNJ66379.1 MAG: CPBP family intramembrane metalloprotease [Leptolyngbya sp. IPPAS B-1204]
MAALQQFGILFALGSLGIVLFVITSIPVVQQQLAALPAATAVAVPPLWVLMLLQGLQYAVLLTIAICVGIVCTRSVGLRSHLIDYWVFHRPKFPSFAHELKWSLGVGATTTVLILMINHWMEPALPETLRAANQAEPNWLTSLAAMLYGGITEEILMRWGLMSLLVWVGWKLLKQEAALPSQAIYQGAIVLAAVVFGLLHLPMTATIAPLTFWVILRAILLNGIAGTAYGWLFWQYSLEAAMIAHASFHAVVFALNVLLARFV